MPPPGPGGRRRPRLPRRSPDSAGSGSQTRPLGIGRAQTRPLPLPGADRTEDGDRSPTPTLTRVASGRTRELIGSAVRRVRSASRADGAGASGLSGLVTVNALHAAGDAMIVVSLAGTLFFVAPADAQRGNVALYLLITVVPFAVLAPVLGPVLDRVQSGRRWALAASLGGRALLAVSMSAFYDGLALYPAALGALVLSKGFNVLRAAVVPRVLPVALPLTSANARLSVFGLAAGAGAGVLAAGIASAAGFVWELGAAAGVFTAAAVLAVRLPRSVDVPVPGEPADLLRTIPLRTSGRLRGQGSPHVTTALRATAALRGLGGFLTIFCPFLVQATVTGGWPAVAALGAIATAAAAGSFGGTAAGSRLRSTAPDTLVLVSAGSAAVVTLAAAALYSLPMVALVAGVSAVTNALGKVALDAIIQREVPEALRASAFARSETGLQLAWVAGGVAGVALPAIGRLGFTVVAALLTLAVGVTLVGRHRAAPRAAGRELATGPGADRIEDGTERWT